MQGKKNPATDHLVPEFRRRFAAALLNSRSVTSAICALNFS